jgi:hypothetical protein
MRIETSGKYAWCTDLSERASLSPTSIATGLEKSTEDRVKKCNFEIQFLSCLRRGGVVRQRAPEPLGGIT